MSFSEFVIWLLVFIVGYTMVYPIVDRICSCIEHCVGKETKEENGGDDYDA